MRHRSTRDQYLRHRRNQAAAKATARALERALVTATGFEARRIAVSARRMTACAASHFVKIVTPDNEESRLEISHRGSCKIGTVCSLCAPVKAARARRACNEKFEIIRELEPEAPIAVLTLTAANRPLSDLKVMLDDHEAALQRFWRTAPIKTAVLGHVTALECVVRGTPESPEAGVHSHSGLVLHKDYFSRQHNLYLPQARLVGLWRRALGVDYSPIVYVERARGTRDVTDMSAIRAVTAEICKYATDFSKMLEKGTFGITANPVIVAALLSGFYRRRTLKFGGIFSQAQKIRTTRAKAREGNDHA